MWQKSSKNRQKPLLRKKRSQKTEVVVLTIICFLEAWLSPLWVFIIRGRRLWLPSDEPQRPRKSLSPSPYNLSQNKSQAAIFG